MKILNYFISIFITRKIKAKHFVRCGIYTKIKGVNIHLGSNVSIYGRIFCSSNGKVLIGDNTTVRFKSIIESESEVNIGKNVIISNNVIISDNDSHPTDPKIREKMSIEGPGTDLWTWKHSVSKPIYIEENVWIGRNSTISKGVRIGRGSIVASNTVVTKSIPPYSLVYGNPCIIKEGKYLK